MNHIIGLALITQINSLLNLNCGLVENFVTFQVLMSTPINQIATVSEPQKTMLSEICHQDLNAECLPLLSMSNGRPVSEIDYPMKITFRQSGGYAGLTKGCEIDTELLSSEEAQELKSLVAQTGILEAQSKQSPNVADAYNYLIIIETRERIHQVSFDQLSLSQEVIPLINFLKDRSDYIKVK